MTFTFNCLVQNEMEGPEWDKVVDYEGQAMRLGDAVMLDHGITPHAYWRWAGPLVLFGYCIVLNVLNIVALTVMDSECVSVGVQLMGGARLFRMCWLVPAGCTKLPLPQIFFLTVS